MFFRMSQVIYRGPSINRVKRLGLMMSTVPPGKSKPYRPWTMVLKSFFSKSGYNLL